MECPKFENIGKNFYPKSVCRRNQFIIFAGYFLQAKRSADANYVHHPCKSMACSECLKQSYNIYRIIFRVIFCVISREWLTVVYGDLNV